MKRLIWKHCLQICCCTHLMGENLESVTPKQQLCPHHPQEQGRRDQAELCQAAGGAPRLARGWEQNELASWLQCRPRKQEGQVQLHEVRLYP